MSSKTKHRRRVPRDMEQLRLEQEAQRARKISTSIVAEVAERLSSPTADADMVGEQTHFLRRIDRLPDTARGLAVRLYYSFELRRFVAREALGLRTDLPEPDDPADLSARRVVVDVEPGPRPSRVILDGRGKVITCLAAGMAVGSGARMSHERYRASVERFGRHREANQKARETAEELDVFTHIGEIALRGWLAPREDVEALLRLGPAAGLLLNLELRSAMRAASRAETRAITVGAPQNDAHISEWFDRLGWATAMLAVLVELGIEPIIAPIHHLVWAYDFVTVPVLGACLARWRPDDGDKLFLSLPDNEGRDPSNPARQCGHLVYLGVLRRQRLARGDPPAPDDRRFRWLADLLETYENGLAEERRLGIESDSMHVFVRDLALLCGGGRPDWGDDLVDDPDTLPPLLITDLCQPGYVTSPRALRILVQRLLACAERPFTHLFLPAAELDRWRARLGAFRIPREGKFTAPWVNQAEPAPVHLNLPGRNEPCPCGSGKKFKKCCLSKMEAGER